MRVYLCFDKIASKRKNKKRPNVKDLVIKQKDQY